MASKSVGPFASVFADESSQDFGTQVDDVPDHEQSLDGIREVKRRAHHGVFFHQQRVEGRNRSWWMNRISNWNTLSINGGRIDGSSRNEKVTL